MAKSPPSKNQPLFVARKRLKYSPEVVFQAHIHWEDFLTDCVKFQEKRKEYEESGLSQIEYSRKINILFAEFERRYPYWKDIFPVPDQYVINSCKKGDFTYESFVDRDNIKPVSVMYNYNTLSAIMAEKKPGFVHHDNRLHLLPGRYEHPNPDLAPENDYERNQGRFLRVEIDLLAKNKSILSEVNRLLLKYKESIGTVKGDEKRNNSKYLKHLEIYNLRNSMKKEGRNPLLPKNLKELFPALSEESARRNLALSCEKAKAILGELGLVER
jgi:hypothetical protein